MKFLCFNLIMVLLWGASFCSQLFSQEFPTLQSDNDRQEVKDDYVDISVLTKQVAQNSGDIKIIKSYLNLPRTSKTNSGDKLEPPLQQPPVSFFNGPISTFSYGFPVTTNVVEHSPMHPRIFAPAPPIVPFDPFIGNDFARIESVQVREFRNNQSISKPIVRNLNRRQNRMNSPSRCRIINGRKHCN